MDLNKKRVFHKQLTRARGRADSYKCHRCDDCAYDWAWIHDRDSLDFNNYMPLCRSCHRKYDMTDYIRECAANANIGENNHSHKLKDSDIANIHELKLAGLTRNQIAHIYNMNAHYIGSIINGHNRTRPTPVGGG